jgi:dipeptidyl aminopeptidase/acylaminoacyl peptidase
MKKILLFFLSLPVLAQVERREMGNIVSENIPAFPKNLTEKLYQYQNTRSAGFVAWLPDGKGMLISTRFGETTQLHRVDAPKSDRQQITFFPEPVGAAVFPENPAGKTFYFLKDVGGGEFYQIFSFDMRSGKSEMLTDGTSRNGSPLFSRKGDKFIFTSTRRNKKDSDFYISDRSNAKTTKLLMQTETGGWGAADWSPDDKQLLVQQYISVNESYLHLMDAESGKLLPINEGKKSIAYSSGLFSKDGKGIYIVSDENTEFQTLRYYDLATKTFKPLTASINWDVEDVELSPDGNTLAFTTNEDGTTKLYLMDTHSQTYKPVQNLPVGLIGGLKFHPDNKQLAFTLNNAQTPSDVFVLNVSDNSLARWTYSEVGGLNTQNFVSPTLIHYETFDKVGKNPRMIPAFYYKPRQAKGKLPVIISIHGGPEGQSFAGFSSLNQFLLNEMEVALLVPNVRGSTGYGKTYVTLDNGFKREESVQDIGKLLDWIARQPELDASRVMVYGGSYGGYMVLACMTNFNDRLRGGIDLFGISNFVTFLEKTEAYRRDLRRVEYGDERDPQMKEHLLKISPANNAKKITKPMFIYQGLNDPRVPVGESEQMVKMLREQGNTVWYMLAKDEGHSLAKKTNRDFHNAAMMLFLEKFMLTGN